MNLSDLQNKEIIDISTGKRMGNIIDVVINRDGDIIKFKRYFTSDKRYLNIYFIIIKKKLVFCGNKLLG